MKNAILVLGICFGIAISQESKTFSFTESSENFPNPERGFNVALNMDSKSSLDQRSKGISLVFGRVIADDFTTKPLSEEFLAEFDGFFAKARKAGVKLNPRVAYNYSSGGRDAPINIILEHIQQLQPVLVKNKDVLNVFDLGFIGKWGEWHSSTNNLNTPENEKAILEAVLKVLPQDRMTYIRYPHIKRRIFGGDYNATGPWLDSTTAFNGSNLARVGHLNDCFLSSPGDVGTYQKGWPRSKEIEYIGQESRFTPHGGETCAVTNESKCPNALAEMAQLHTNHLHIGFHRGVIDRWRSEGCFEEISIRLGYRFALQSTTLDTYLPPGGTMNLAFTVKNSGFGELFNPRPVEVVLIGANGVEIVAPISIDPRWWGAGKSHTVSVKMKIPIGISEGTYKVALRLPDASESIRKDYRYAIQFANKGVWDPANGTNLLASGIRIAKAAPGLVTPGNTVFAQLGGTISNVAVREITSHKYSISWLKDRQTIAIQGIGNLESLAQVSILDLHGRVIPGHGGNFKVPAQGQIEVPMAGLIGGIYYVQIRQGSREFSHKITTL